MKSVSMRPSTDQSSQNKLRQQIAGDSRPSSSRSPALLIPDNLPAPTAGQLGFPIPPDFTTCLSVSLMLSIQGSFAHSLLEPDVCKAEKVLSLALP